MTLVYLEGFEPGTYAGASAFHLFGQKACSQLCCLYLQIAQISAFRWQHCHRADRISIGKDRDHHPGGGPIFVLALYSIVQVCVDRLVSTVLLPET